ncbi:MAG: PKD domain-containing protein, partial [Ginsengibacter sp.]
MKTLTFSPIESKVNKYLALIFFFLLSSFFADAQLGANFSASPNAGCAPLVVQFSDSSIGNPTSWKWDLGNGTSSVLQNPSVAYFDPGTYTVKLIITNSYGVDSVTKVQFITVYSSPVINFDASNLTGCFPLKTQFKDNSSAESGSLNNWQWDFGDGNFASIQNPQHTYTSVGNFNVSLRATNNFGCVTSKTVKSFIHIETGVKADFKNAVSKTCNAPATISFLNQSSGVGLLNYQWDFGDGSSSTASNPSHTYDSSGTYTVSLVVANATGCTDTLIKPHLIIVGSTKADFAIPEILCAQTPVYLKNTSNPVPASASWDFGNGTRSDSVNAIAIFKLPGDYKIKMISNNGACMDSVTKTLTVIAKPSVSFKSNDTVSCEAPFNAYFNNTSSGTTNSSRSTSAVQTYYWDFGDGGNSTQQSPSHTYTQEGNYTVKLWVTNASGCTDSVVKTNFIKIKKPVVTLNNLPQQGCAPLSHKFTSTVNSLDPVTNFHWDFGDGNSSDSATPTHVYTTPGKYNITLTYTTNGGCVDSVQKISGIIIGTKPTSTFIADPLETCAVKPMNFSDKSGGAPDHWIWFFGDGESAVTQNPAHQYSDTGFFSVTLISINNGCADTLTMKNEVHIHPPVALFSYLKTCSVPRQVIFSDKSLGADYWNWNFGDGNTSTTQNPVHDYTTPGKYTVSLTVTNNASGCSETKTDTIQIIHEVADFTLTNSETCRNTPVTFNAVNSIPGHISSYNWQFGDGVSFAGTLNAITHKYQKASAYNITLILKDVNGCLDSMTKPLAVQVNGPTAIFKSAIPGTCLNNSVNFIDSSFSDGNHAIQQWNWNWGDGKTENLNAAPFNHIYSAPGIYSVSLIVTDTKGCTDTLKKTNVITVSQPVAAFTADTLSCTSKAINFANSSSGTSLVYTWNFGDGTSSSEKNPVHLYTAERTYNVSLSINDQYGCNSFVSKENYVRIGNPKADFATSDTIGTCPPLVANFTNNSVNYSTWAWDFGDGTTSTEKNPSHFYSSAGIFNAVLTITGPGGCTSQKTQRIKVDGPSGILTYDNLAGCKPLATKFQAHTKKNTSFVWDFNDGSTISTQDSNVVHTYTTAGKYLPKMILEDDKGCKVAVKGNDSVIVYGIAASFKHNGALVCDSSRISFVNSSITNDKIATYIWNFGDGQISGDEQPSHIYNRPGSYKTSLKVITQNGCMDSIQNPDLIHVNRSPKIVIHGSVGSCVPAVMIFSGIVSNPDTSTVSWKWDFANGNVSTLQKPVSQTYPTAGSFTVNAIGYSSNGCNDTAQKNIEIYPLPNLSISADTVVCFGTPQTLNASGAQTYSWSSSKYLSCTNCAAPVARPDSAIQYHLKGTSDKGCVSYDSVSLTLKYPFKLSFSKSDTLCVGKSVKLFVKGTEKYTWSPATGLDNPLSSSPTASPVSSTNYQVIGSDSKGCFKDT